MTNDQEFHAARQIVAFRLLGLSVSSVAAYCGVSESAVKRTLLKYGNVPPRGRGHHWRGVFSISEETAAQLRLPPYIPHSVDGVLRIACNAPYMILTHDMPITIVDGKRRPISGDDPFYVDQGLDD